MPIFIIFVFASVVFGAGAMLCPALPTRNPRIGLAAALALGFVVSGAIFWAALFGWNTLVIDYLWFALIVGIFLSGTLSAGMFRAEASGLKEYTGWPGPRELAFFLTMGFLFAVPALILPVPLNTDAQGIGYLALMLHNGGNLTTLAPYHPEISALYSPGLPMLAAYLSQQLHGNLQNILLGIGVVLPVLLIWVAYDFGNEITADESRTGGIVMACCALIGTGLIAADLASHYTALLGVIFILAFLTFAIRFYREGRRVDFVSAAVMLACVALSQPDLLPILILAYIGWLVMIAISNRSVKGFLIRWCGLALGIPALALIGILPWLSKILPLLSTGLPSSPTGGDPINYLGMMITYHGGVIVLLAVIGIWARFREKVTPLTLTLSPTRREREEFVGIDVMMLVWLIVIIVTAIVPSLANYTDPYNIFRYGPIIPYLYFGSAGLFYIMDRIGRERFIQWSRAASLPILTGLLIIAALILGNSDSIIAISKNTPLAVTGALSSQADVQAMNWLTENTPPEALILNHPGPGEGDWVPVIAQRNAVYFPIEPYDRNTDQVIAMQNDLRALWQHPADPGNVALLKRYGVSYIIVPQVINRPDALQSMFRWRSPSPDALAYGPLRQTDVPYLDLMADFDGAQIYQLKPDDF